MWTISNLLSLSRLILAFPMAVLLMQGQNWAAFVLGILAVGTDLLDGYLARKLDQVTELGKIIDPIADKALVGTVAVCSVLNGIIPLWFVIAIVLRDVLILAGGVYARSKMELVIPSNYVGKVTVMIVSLTMGGAFLGIQWCSVYGVYVSLGALIISLAVYTMQMIAKLKAVEQKAN